MIVKLAKEFISLVSGKYPHNMELKMESLRFKSIAAEAENLSVELRESILLDLVAAIEDFLATGSGEIPYSVFSNQYNATRLLEVWHWFVEMPPLLLAITRKSGSFLRAILTTNGI
jgi:hypothetical protein